MCEVQSVVSMSLVAIDNSKHLSAFENTFHRSHNLGSLETNELLLGMMQMQYVEDTISVKQR